MTAEMSEARLQAVLALPPERRHAWFLQRVRESGEAWGLYAEGWALAKDDQGNDVLPLWPTQAFAQRCAIRLWASFVPRRVALSELLEELLPALAEEALAVGVFFNPEGQGWPVAAQELGSQLVGHASA
ncbi:DUF2750 domain-containing protein [Stigmatella sp. ncwal1]|uniref:DUF2750 domain-containing protein n=1 Tax=Stigmatella ashevillensis TaxID=2995309 RepID=A0ABT5DJ43_9BACT|nr:DUF2750 domain-containing protein [Stigmatella ashevillena]MDC0712381.1 DUF2750 domain-containing protein [Stigmatella ashevillena]